MKLSENLLIEICKKSLENAKSLLSDADLLKAHKRIPRSYALYQFATEELGKSIYCYLIMFEERYTDPRVTKEFKKVFFSHQEKTNKSTALNIVIAQILFKGNFKGALNFIQESIDERARLQEIDNFKNNSLYTSIIDSKVINPVEIITDDLLSKIEIKAKTRYNAISVFVTIGIEHLPTIREHKRTNPNYELDSEKHAEEFWHELMK